MLGPIFVSESSPEDDSAPFLFLPEPYDPKEIPEAADSASELDPACADGDSYSPLTSK